MLPLVLRHIEVEASAITLLTAPDRGAEAAAAAARYGTHCIVKALTPDNFEEVRARCGRPAARRGGRDPAIILCQPTKHFSASAAASAA